MPLLVSTMPGAQTEDAFAVRPIRSMTGYALARAQTAAGELTVSLRSVNHRALDLHFHLNGQLAPFENAMRALIKQHIARGHVEVRAALAQEAGAADAAFSRDMLKRYIGLFYEAAEEFHLKSEPDLNAFFALPGVFDNARDSRALEADFEPVVLSTLAACLDELNAYREREARELADAFEREIAAIEKQAAEMVTIRAAAIPHFVERLRERVAALLANANIPEARLLEEAAMLADRSDIQEELARLVVHTREARRILASGGEIGKRLDFLLQEMNRETNTILSKTSGIGEGGLTITNLALETRANIERIREQALNLE